MGQANKVVAFPGRTDNPVKTLLEQLLNKCNDYSKVVVSVEDKHGKVIHQVAKIR